MSKKKWYKKTEIWALIVAILAIGISGLSIWFSYQSNQISIEGNTISNENLICSDADSRLKAAYRYVEYQKSCNLSEVDRNEAILINANRYRILENCSKSVDELTRLNLTQCEEKEELIAITGTVIGIKAFTFLIVLFVVVIFLTSLAIYSKTRTKKEPLKESHIVKKQFKAMDKRIGHYSFIIGVIIAIVLGLALPLGAATTAWLTSILVILGLIVGFLNVTGKETKEFMLVALVLVLVSFAGNAVTSLSDVMYIGSYLSGIFNAIMAFVVPAIVVVALKKIRYLAE